MSDQAEPDRSPNDRWRDYALPAALATVAFVLISMFPSADRAAKYRWSFASLVPLTWVIVLLRRRLALTPTIFVLFLLALLAHDMGAFGWYQRDLGIVQYDWLVHGWFGVVGGIAVARALELRVGVAGRAVGLLTVLVVTGLGGLHEIMEASTTMFLGDQYGMLHVGSDPYDTQQDMLCNVVGSTGAVLLRRSARPRS